MLIKTKGPVCKDDTGIQLGIQSHCRPFITRVYHLQYYNIWYWKRSDLHWGWLGSRTETTWNRTQFCVGWNAPGVPPHSRMITQLTSAHSDCSVTWSSMSTVSHTSFALFDCRDGNGNLPSMHTIMIAPPPVQGGFLTFEQYHIWELQCDHLLTCSVM